MSKNTNLHDAKKAKKDEFFTQISDIEKELNNYKDYLNGKIIFCNCDDPEESDFWKYFALNFEILGLKKLVSTHYEIDKPSYKLEIIKDAHKKIVKTTLKQNGDFRSSECIEILKEADIIVTNPPFSLFREYMAQLIEYDKQFLIIGSLNAITYKEIFKLIKDNQLWLGQSYPKEFIQPDGTKKKFGNILWYTNIDYTKRYENIILSKQYTPKEYPKYDNYDAINVDKVNHIPRDYTGHIGVPITFLTKYNPEQFEIIALGIVGSIDFTCDKKMEILGKDGKPTNKFTYNAKGTLYRLFNPKTDKTPAFRNCNTKELYSSIYARVIVKNKKI